MNENVCKEIDPEELAEKLNISYSWFRKTFKNIPDILLLNIFRNLNCEKPNKY